MSYPTGIANGSAKVGKVARAGLGANTYADCMRNGGLLQQKTLCKSLFFL